MDGMWVSLPASGLPRRSTRPAASFSPCCCRWLLAAATPLIANDDGRDCRGLVALTGPRPRGRAGVPGACRGRRAGSLPGARRRQPGDPLRGHPPRRLERPDDVQHRRRRRGLHRRHDEACSAAASRWPRPTPVTRARTATTCASPRPLLDYAYRGVHLATAAAKRVIQRYYGREIDYLVRQGLLERRPRGDVGGEPAFRTTTTASWPGRRLSVSRSSCPG